MAFTSFASIDDIVKKYKIVYQRRAFVSPIPGVAFSESYREELALTLEEVPYHRSESFTCEALIYPTLREIWKAYRSQLSLFSHEPIHADSDLRGEVDYVVCKRSELGSMVLEHPFLLIGEAKKDDTTAGWGQALGGMIAAQKLDGNSNRTFFGLTTNGLTWSFGKLTNSLFVQHTEVFSLNQEELAGALHFIFRACLDQIHVGECEPSK